MLHNYILHKLLKLNQAAIVKKKPGQLEPLLNWLFIVRLWLFLCSPFISRQKYIVSLTKNSQFHLDTNKAFDWLMENCDAWALFQRMKEPYPVEIYFADSDKALAFKLAWS